MKVSRYRLLVLLVAAVLLLPWGGCTRFNTKGEPREAIVAVSMLQSGDYVLPTSYGKDIPYKPPMLAWCIAGTSAVLNGSHVSEFTSRLPSALAAIALVWLTFEWVARRRSPRVAAATALVMFTSFEVFRAAVVCRVDMLLTLFIVGAIYLLDTSGVESRRRKAWMYVGAWVMMSCATLTKGPVGALLPCLVVGVFRLVEGRGFWRTLGIMALMAVLSLALPMVWYCAAYGEGGEQFVQLAMEENIGRLTGTMSYDSHINPWYYNVYVTLGGMLPWTLLALFALGKVKWQKPHLRSIWGRIRTMNHNSLLALTAAVVIFVFYCIPASKRSVYLLPCYPFIAFGIVMMVERIQAAGGWRKLRLIPLSLGVAALYLVYLSIVQPLMLNPRSNEPAARDVEALQPAGPVYSFVNDKDGLNRYYTVNYYLGDRMLRMEDGAPAAGSEALLLMPEHNRTEFARRWPHIRLRPTGKSFITCDGGKENVVIYKMTVEATK